MKNLPNTKGNKLLHKHSSSSWEETHLLGKALAKELSANALVALCGDLGSGKTTFIRGIAEGIGGIDLRTICSPTFTLLNVYPGTLPLYHFDLYRLPHATEFFNAGFDEYFYAGGICLIEWAEKIQEYLPASTLFLDFSYSGSTQREIEILKFLIKGERSKDIANSLGIHASTLGTHKFRILNKFRVTNVIKLKEYIEKFQPELL